jgi:outer membrane protein assembly factor BamB
MEYDSYREIPWYWTLLFSVFSLAVIGFVLWTNPYLYDRLELRTALAMRHSVGALPMPLPSHQIHLQAEHGEPVYSAFEGVSHGGFDLSGKTWSRSFFNIEKWPVPDSPNAVGSVIGNEFYILSGNTLSQYYGDGKLHWQFKFLTLPLPSFALDQAALYMALPSGQIFSIDRSSGQLIWTIDLGSKIQSQPFLINDTLYVFIKPAMTLPKRTSERGGRGSRNAEKTETKQVTKGLTLVSLQRAHGQLQKVWPTLSELEDAPVTASMNETAEELYLVQGRNLAVYDFATMKNLWHTTLTENIFGPLIVTGDSTFVATRDGKIASFSSIRGRKNWDAEIGEEILSEMTLVPSINGIALFTKPGALRFLDAQTGNQKWMFQLNDDVPHPFSFASRFNGPTIQEIKMKWIHKGWALFASCGKSKVCIYNPDNGQVVSHIPFNGSPLMRPDIFGGRNLAFVTEKPEDHLQFEFVTDRGGYLQWAKQHGKVIEHDGNEESF